ncbi:MAG: peptidylprolyl isomerase [Paenibacillaceae bacterium]|jgi:foldase protein PrsA|nr:peptidylprolyl isomerase [Paenibacillaceae bacterium]
MRNIKLLRGLVVCLMAAVLALSLLLARNMAGSEATDGEKTPDVLVEDRVVAKIGSREFKLSVLRDQLLEKYGRELVNQLLDREALRLEAEEQNLKITREEVDAELKRMQQGYDSEEIFYESMLSQIGLSKEDIREDVYYKLILEKVATRTIVVTDQEISSYIKEHPEEFGLVSLLRIEKIINQNEEQAKRTLELYKSGTDFGVLARERSLDTATAADGGDLGWVEDNDPFVSEEILKAARMMKVNEVRGPIPTEEGFAVIRLRDKKEQSKGTTEEIRESVRKMLALQKAPPIQDIVQTLRNKFKAVIMDPELHG